jgi:hypothetical protein
VRNSTLPRNESGAPHPSALQKAFYNKMFVLFHWWHHLLPHLPDMAIALQISPQSYLMLSALLWHIALPVVFVVGLFLAGPQGMNIFWH